MASVSASPRAPCHWPGVSHTPHAARKTTAEEPALTPRPWIRGLPACHGATPEIAPARIRAAAAFGGVPVGPLRRVLLLDCGTGRGLALLAAATAGTGVEVWGATAFAEEAEAARALAAEAELDLNVLETPADRLAARDDLPSFDVVAAPSGWTRLSEPERRGVAALLARRLAPGGAFLLTRETLPGAVERVLLRRVLRLALEAATHGSAEAPPAERVAAALTHARRLLPQSHLLVRLLVNWEAALDWLATFPPEVALREWFGPEGPAWTAGETAAALAPAGFAARIPADPFGAPAELTVAPEQRLLIATAPADALAAETEAMLLGDDRRSDLFVKPGGAPVPLESLRFARTADPWKEPLRPAGLGERAALDAEAHAPAFEALEREEAPTVAEVAARIGASPAEAAERLRALAGAGLAAPAGGESPTAAARAASARLNRSLILQGPGEALAAPRLGGAMPIGPATRRALADGAGDAARAALARLGGL